MGFEGSEKRNRANITHNLLVSYDILVEEAKELGPLMRCDFCLEYWPIENFCKKVYVRTGGDLLCVECR